MTDSSIIDYPVYVGVWTNWSKGGRVSGSVITLTHRNGALLTAFLALFVTFTSSRLWRILCFALHRLLARPEAQDGLYHQRQAILRNTLDEKSALISFIRLLRAWQSRAPRSLYRLLPLITLSVFVSAGFTLGSIFSSKISSLMGNEVLISSTQCGILSWNSLSGQASSELDADIYNAWLAERMTSYANYAQRCYLNSSRAGDCSGPYVQRNLVSVVNKNASCPFRNKICYTPNNNLEIDTGYLNSHLDLGINTPLDSQYNIRILTHCAPLKAEGYRKTVYYSHYKPYLQYFYGPKFSSQEQKSFTYEMPQQSIDEMKWVDYATASPEYLVGYVIV